MSDDFWAETDQQLNECFKAYYQALDDAKEARRLSIIAYEKWVEAADEVERLAKWNLRFARKQLLFQEKR